MAVFYENSQDVAKELKDKYSDNIFLFQGSIGEAFDVERFFQEALNHFREVDVLINNAAIAHYGFLCDSDNDSLKTFWILTSTELFS